MTSDTDKKYMQAALKLARRGIGSVEPNPAVGCVLVKSDKIIGRGWHKKFGGPHAEINALKDCQLQGLNPHGATAYVTLEPCCHRGKTGACSDAIIAAGLSKVVAAMIDPSAHAGGKGFEQLRKAGIEVKTGSCQREAELLNAPFFKFASTGKCWVILKWAQSIDGKMSWSKQQSDQRWISCEKSRKDVLKLRRRVQGILVGINTVIADDPLLTARPAVRGKKLTRIVLDSKLRMPLNCRLLATARKSPLLIATTTASVRSNPQRVEQITRAGAELLEVPTVQGRCDIKYLLELLSKRNISQLLVEGGPTVLTAFLKYKLADQVCVYIAPKALGQAGDINITEQMAKSTDAFGLYNITTKRLDTDTRICGMITK